jgi:hypothetical protein
VPRSGEGRPLALGQDAVRVALLSLGLAVLLEVLQAIATAVSGAGYSAPMALRDTLLKVPWAVIVCMLLWVALRIAAGHPGTVAVIGLLAAPVASLLARAGAEIAHTLFASAEPTGVPPPLLVAASRGVEYACLGLLLLWLGGKLWSNALHHAGAGLLVGLVFGGFLLRLTAIAGAGALSAGSMTAWVANELLFPAGCALIVFSTTRARAG